ncbi:MAG: CoA-binding protein [Patescibacteria group bacterium]
MTDEQLRKILTSTKTIAAVGVSAKRERPSNAVCRFLQAQGYRVIPVNPAETEVLGEKTFSSLDTIVEPVDLILVFRKPEFAPELAEAAIRIGAKVFWLQDGAGNPAAAKRAEEAGLTAVVDDCLMRQFVRLAAIAPIAR